MRLLRAFGLVALMTTPGAAQHTASLVGTLTDSAGRPVPRAIVNIPGTAYYAYPDDAGQYRLDRLPPGHVPLRAAAPRYKSIKHDNVVLVAGRTTQVDFRLARKTLADDVIPVRSPMPPDSGLVHITAGASKGPNESVRKVVRAAEPWAMLWREANDNRLGPPAATPMVDFGRDMVVVASLGGQPTTGWEIRIDSVYRVRDTIRVVIGTGAAPCIAGQMVTYPWDAVRVPRDEGPVRFVEYKELGECD